MLQLEDTCRLFDHVTDQRQSQLHVVCVRVLLSKGLFLVDRINLLFCHWLEELAVDHLHILRKIIEDALDDVVLSLDKLNELLLFLR